MWYRVFGTNDNQAAPEAILAQLGSLGCAVTADFHGGETGWVKAEISFLLSSNISANVRCGWTRAPTDEAKPLWPSFARNSGPLAQGVKRFVVLRPRRRYLPRSALWS